VSVIKHFVLDSIWLPEQRESAGKTVHGHKVQDCCVHWKRMYSCQSYKLLLCILRNVC